MDIYTRMYIQTENHWFRTKPLPKLAGGDFKVNMSTSDVL